MVTLVDLPEELKLPLSDTIKFCILGISVMLLLLALGILAWQAIRCCTHTPYTRQDIVKSEPLHSNGKYTTAGASEKNTVEDTSMEVRRLSRSFSQASFPSSESILSDGDTGGQDGSQKINGSLRFSVYYDQLQSRLVVTILEVEGLQEQSQTRSLQPFVKIRLMWAGLNGGVMADSIDEEDEGMPPVLWTVLQEWRTRVVKGSCDPLFGDQFSCVLCGDKELHHMNLRMEVRDFDKFSRHTVLGEVRVCLGQLNISSPLELQEDLQTPQKDLVGEVLLSLKFLPTSQRLEVGLLKVRAVLTEACSDTAMYARISVQCNQCKLRYQKTSTVTRCVVTVFNEVLMFSLPELPLEQCKILVSVYETKMTRKSNKTLIGQLTVGKERSSEDKHWGLMMCSVRQPVARWHGLLI